MQKILFECHHLYYLPNFIPVIKELQALKNSVIILSIPETMPSFEKNGIMKAAEDMNIAYINGENEEDRLKILKKEHFDAVVVGNVGSLNSIVTEDSIAVMIYHGIGLKQTYYRDISDRIDIRAVESEERFSILKSRGSSNIYLTGYTKLDPLFKMEYDTDGIIADLGFEADKKTLIYAPTFYPSAIDQILPELEILSATMNVLVKLHQFSWHQSRFRHHSRMVKESAKEYPGIVLLDKEQYDILPFFSISDLLLSDISSTIFEFLPVDKPILLNEFYSLRLKHRLFRKRFNKKIDFERLENIDFVKWVRNSDELGLLIMDGIDTPDEMAKERATAMNRHLYKSDGLASKRLVDILVEKLKTGRI